MKTYTKEQIEEFAREIEAKVGNERITDELWEKIQAVAAYVYNKYQKENNLLN